MSSRPPEQRSLFGEILDWMLAPLLLLWPMSVAVTWAVAQGIANRPYDRELGDLARALSRQIAVQAPASATPGELPTLTLTLPEAAAAALLRTDDEEEVFYQVLGPRGEFLAGDLDLPVPEADIEPSADVRFRDETVHGIPVRVAYRWLLVPPPGDARGSLVQVAATLDKRSRLATEIIKGVILPQFVILPLAVVLVWFALTRGIRPLSDLQKRIRKRESTDLSPIAERDVPDEVVPLVRAINELLERLDRSVRTQQQFLADAAHQLKTPLAGLRMQAELAARQIDQGESDPQAMKHSLVQISLSSQRAARMVNQLLAMARTETREHAMRPARVDLAAMTIDTVRDFVPLAMDKRIDLGYEGPEAGAGAVLTGQPVLLRELVRNLVDNALQYTPAGGTVTARVTPDPFGQVLVLQVEDDGPGVPAAERESVFRPFYRALGTPVDGSGLGLSIVREIAQQHGAEVTIDDAHPSRGATGAGARGPGALFTVRFPLHPSTTASRS